MYVKLNTAAVNNNAGLLIIIFLAVLLLPACARTIAFNSSTVVPAASGKIQLKQDRNKNYALDIKVINLAEPRNLQPPRSTYVVWMETTDHGAKNLGRLGSSTSVFSSALNASLKTVTSFQPVRFFITAEDDASTEYPSSQVVLQTDNYRK